MKFANYRYTFSLSSAKCQSISNIIKGYGQLMVSSTQFFVLSVPPSAPFNLHMYKIEFLSTSVNWAKQIVCPLGTWGASNSESVLSSDSSTIYLFFIFSTSQYYLLFAGLSASDGSVTTTRYRSSAAVFDVLGSALNGDYVVNLIQEKELSAANYKISIHKKLVEKENENATYIWIT